MGKGRTTTGMILACLLKDILFGNNDIIYYKDDKVSKEEFPDEDEYLEEVRILEINGNGKYSQKKSANLQCRMRDKS